jgi:hypothetical protein
VLAKHYSYASCPRLSGGRFLYFCSAKPSLLNASSYHFCSLSVLRLQAPAPFAKLLHPVLCFGHSSGRLCDLRVSLLLLLLAASGRQLEVFSSL